MATLTRSHIGDALTRELEKARHATLRAKQLVSEQAESITLDAERMTEGIMSEAGTYLLGLRAISLDSTLYKDPTLYKATILSPE